MKYTKWKRISKWSSPGKIKYIHPKEKLWKIVIRGGKCGFYKREVIDEEKA
jgi:hypothetical protein